MSASQDKKKRQEERAAGIDKWSVAEREEQKKRQKTKRQWTFGTVVVVLLVALILLANSTLFYTVIPSVTVGDMKYTNAEYQYFFKNSYYSFCNQYQSMLSYFLDTSKPLDEQQCAFAEGKTWEEYFREGALDSMTNLTAMYEAAVAEGYTLSEEDSASIEEEISSFDTYAPTQGYSSGKNFMSAYYGRGVGADTIRKLMGMSIVASNYQQDKLDSFSYTDAELSAWYKDNKDTYDTFDYDYYYVQAETVETTEDVTDAETGETAPQTTTAATEETMAEAKKTADAIAKAMEGDGDAEALELAEAVKEVVPEGEITENTGKAGSSLDSAYAEWMKDASRKAGDVTVAVNGESGYYVVVFNARGDNSYKTVSVRHILVKAEDTDGDGAYSDDEKAAAKAKLDEIYKEWKAGDATEDSFAALANEKSEDAGSNTNGGLYEEIYKGQMVQEFNDFCFAEGRKAGDTGVVYGESSQYSGYHLVYFVGANGRAYCDMLADNALRSEDYSAWQESVTEGWTYSTNLVLKFAAE